MGAGYTRPDPSETTNYSDLVHWGFGEPSELGWGYAHVLTSVKFPANGTDSSVIVGHRAGGLGFVSLYRGGEATFVTLQTRHRTTTLDPRYAREPQSHNAGTARITRMSSFSGRSL